MTFEDFLDPFISALLLAGIYAAMSVGMTIIYGVMKIVNLSHASFMMLGAYFAYEMFQRLHLDPVLGAVAALPVFFVFGMGVYWALVRWLPKSNQPTLPSLLLMFGLSLVLQNIAYLIWQNEDRSITTSYTLSAFHIGPFDISKVRVIVFVAAVVSIIVLQIALRRSWFGRGMRSLVQNPYASQIVGVDERRTSMLTFGLGTAFAGFAGALLGLLFSFSPDFGRPFLLRSFVIIVLGGLESFSGVALGALVLALLESFSIFIPKMEASYQPAISYLLLVVVLLVLPKGIAGLLERKWRSG
ncbi:MAG TPA: branched-chain amino acid ABC transporter permease [Candidatus Angelobacter sp.]|jgi:branched-chain amino acid transport system permease protein|nr:branched-chain amino acid ABC transporter permease [Candidatus Angelobacter sp.]